MAGETGSARQEAERLVATVLAMASQSGPGDARRGGGDQDDTIAGTGARIVEGLGTLGDTLAGMVGHLTGTGQGERPAARTPATGATPRTGPSGGDGPGAADRPVRYGLATGSVECCVCPICRTISSLRDPTPESAARLASGAGDFASGVASLMRAFSAMSGSRPRAARPNRPAPPPEPDLTWSAATRKAPGGGRPEVPDLTPDRDESPWAAATRAAAGEQEPATAPGSGAGQKPGTVPAAGGISGAAAAAADREGSDPGPSAATPDPRTANGSSADAAGARRSGPAPRGRRPGDARDVWAAATTDALDTGDDTDAGSEADRHSEAEIRDADDRRGGSRGGGDARDGGVTGGTAVDHDDAGDDARSGEV